MLAKTLSVLGVAVAMCSSPAAQAATTHRHTHHVRAATREEAAEIVETRNLNRQQFAQLQAEQVAQNQPAMPERSRQEMRGRPGYNPLTGAVGGGGSVHSWGPPVAHN
jgi:hypothetical protein